MNVLQYIGLSTGVPLWTVGIVDDHGLLAVVGGLCVLIGYVGCVGEEVV